MTSNVLREDAEHPHQPRLVLRLAGLQRVLHGQSGGNGTARHLPEGTVEFSKIVQFRPEHRTCRAAARSGR